MCIFGFLDWTNVCLANLSSLFILDFIHFNRKIFDLLLISFFALCHFILNRKFLWKNVWTLLEKNFRIMILKFFILTWENQIRRSTLNFLTYLFVFKRNFLNFFLGFLILCVLQLRNCYIWKWKSGIKSIQNVSVLRVSWINRLILILIFHSHGLNHKRIISGFLDYSGISDELNMRHFFNSGFTSNLTNNNWFLFIILIISIATSKISTAFSHF